MGVYATVKFAMPCQRCHQGTVNAAQIKRGDCRQLPEYQVGERIRFASVRHSEFGTAGEILDAVAVGYPNPCDYCGGFQLASIVLKNGRIVAVRFGRLASAELKRWDFICAREAAPPPSIYELATPADSPQILAYQSAIHAAQCSYW